MELKIKQPAVCRCCGGSQMTWQSSIVNRSEVEQGRLRTNDVECLFFLGCDECSETITTIRADEIALLMNTAA